MKCLIPKPFDAGDLARSTLLCDRHMDPTFFFFWIPLLFLPHPLCKATPPASCVAIQRKSLVWREVWDVKQPSRTFRIVLYLDVWRCFTEAAFCFFFFFSSLSLSSCSQHAPYSSSFMNRDWNFQWIEKNLFYFWLAMYDRTTNLTL